MSRVHMSVWSLKIDAFSLIFFWFPDYNFCSYVCSWMICNLERYLADKLSKAESCSKNRFLLHLISDRGSWFLLMWSKTKSAASAAKIFSKMEPVLSALVASLLLLRFPNCYFLDLGTGSKKFIGTLVQFVAGGGLGRKMFKCLPWRVCVINVRYK